MATELAKAYVQIIPSVQGISSDITNQLDGLKKSADETEKSLSNIGSSAGSVGKDLDGLGKDASSTGSDVDKLGDNAESAGSGIDALGDNAESAGNSISDMADDAGSAGGNVNSLADAASNAAGDVEGLAASAEAAGDGIEALDGVSIDLDTDGAESELDALVAAAEEALDSVEDLDGFSVDIDVDDAVGGMDDIGNAASGAIGDVEDLAGSLGGSLTSGSTDASAAFDSVNTVMDAFVTGGITAGVCAAIGEIVNSLMDLVDWCQQSQSAIAQGTGASGEDLEQFKSQAKEALTQVKQSAETDLQAVSNTLAELNTRLGLTGDDLTDATVLMEDFAAVTGQTGVNAVDSIANVMNKWGIEAEDMPGLLDQITVAAQNSGISAQELESALASNSEQFAALGYSTEDALAMLASYGQVTGSTSELSTALTRGINNLNGEVEDVPGAFQEALSAIADADSSLDALNTEVGNTGMTVEDVFGNRVVQNIYAGLHNSSDTLSDFQSALADSNGAMEQTADNSITFKDRVSGGMQSLKVAVTNFGGKIRDAFTGVGDSASLVSEGIAEGLAASSGVVYNAAGELGFTVAEGVDDALEMHSPSQVMIRSGENVTAGLAEGMSNMPDEIMSTLDETLANIDGFGADATSSLSTSAADAMAAIDTSYSQAPTTVGGALASALSEVTSWSSSSTGEATSSSTNFVSNVKAGLATLASTVQSPLTAAFGNTTSWSSDMTGTATTSGTGFVNNISTAMNSIGSKVLDKLKQVNTQSSSWSSGLTSDFTSMGKNVMQGLINGMDKMVQPLYSSIKSSLSGLVSKAKNALGIGSPSKVFRDEIGFEIGEGLALGIDDSEYMVDASMDDLMDATEAQAEMADVAVGGVNGQGGYTNTYTDISALLALLQEYLPQLANMEVVMDSGELVGSIDVKMNRALGKLSAKEARRG